MKIETRFGTLSLQLSNTTIRQIMEGMSNINQRVINWCSQELGVVEKPTNGLEAVAQKFEISVDVLREAVNMGTLLSGVKHLRSSCDLTLNDALDIMKTTLVAANKSW